MGLRWSVRFPYERGQLKSVQSVVREVHNAGLPATYLRQTCSEKKRKQKVVDSRGPACFTSRVIPLWVTAQKLAGGVGKNQTVSFLKKICAKC